MRRVHLRQSKINRAISIQLKSNSKIRTKVKNACPMRYLPTGVGQILMKMKSGLPTKTNPDWARTDALITALTKQASVDPDSIFHNATKTCSLGSVFTSHTVEKMENRRSSSGDWFSDRLTWREELRYKQDMDSLLIINENATNQVEIFK